MCSTIQSSIVNINGGDPYAHLIRKITLIIYSYELQFIIKGKMTMGAN